MKTYLMESSEIASERVVTLMTPTEKTALEDKARRVGISVGEFVRQSVDAFDPAEAADLAELTALASELTESNREAAAALDRALASIQATRSQLDRQAAA